MLKRELTEDTKAFYINRLHKLNEQLTGLHQKIQIFSWLRLASFALMIGFIYGFASTGNTFFLITSFFALILLTVLVVYHQKLYNRREKLSVMAEINQNELTLLQKETSIFDNGSAFIARLPFADDLDLFGPYSLYQTLNRCSTSFGKGLLAESLITTPTKASRILKLQEAIAQMAKKLDFNQETIVSLLLAYRKKDHKEFVPSEDDAIYLFTKPFYKIAWILLPLLVAFSFVHYLITANFALFILNGSVAFLFAFAQARKMSLLSEEISGFGQSLKTYGKLLDSLLKEETHGEVLAEMKSVAAEASNGMIELSKISEWFDRRANILLYALGNLFLMYDLQLAMRYEQWKRKYHTQMPEWMLVVGRLEMLISFGIFNHNHPEFVQPELSEEPELFANALGHPLIDAEKRVNNDVHLHLKHRLVLVTGSNMSGKSTWLRTLGVNLLLAQAGAAVCAKSFRWKPMPVLSSLRQSDSLHENTSLFMNELKQLKAILDQAASGEFCLILLDEVLRGTNSEDKYTGSHALIQRLVNCNSLVVMASHDLKLSVLEKELDGKVVNYCFESRIENGQLLFDYTIRKGVAVNRNATWLMQDMGIIDK
jgi:ABC-type multidrug transport system fused ATPase/permease subunit